MGPRRVMPLSLLAAEYPAVTRQLEDRAAATAVNPIDGEYLLLQRAEWNSDGDHPPFESELFDALREGPCAMAQIHAIVRHPELYSRYLTRIERQGIVIRAGFTPTDAAHVLGHYREWHVPAARYGAELLARRIGTDFETLCERILSMTAEQIAREIVLKLLSDEGSNGHMGTDTALITRALRPPSDAALLCRLTVQPPLVAIGAPVRTYFPAVADLLHGRLRIPEHTGSANAIGAVVGSIVHRAHALVVPHEDEKGYRVHLPDRVCDFPTLDEATACAQEIGRDLAIEYAERAGAQAVRVQIVRRDRTAPVAEGWGDELYIQTEFEITAAGRPRIARE
ncbi:MAG TPA: hypothetical protein GX702_15125 [Chloroflexi bacterium]|nr:hypothetical protein [Chloroflexota bacterium]